MKMRELISHKVESSAVESLRVFALDEPGLGNACHRYGIDLLGGESCSGPSLPFQKGAIKEVGINGITNECLLAIVIDRLQGFQSGSFACRENAIALTKLQESLHWLHHRTRERIARGVEGTMQK
jgi:hypothetical protein